MFLRRTITLAGLLFSLSAGAQLPTAQSIASQMTVGWNLGNTLEAICGETAWGGAVTTQQLIDSVKAQGFNTVRIPCAWDCHATNGVIDPTWMARVKQVVDYCINDKIYVILNIHWDDGWLENNCTTAAQASVNAKQQNYWTQIAKYFNGEDEHLLFASANEPDVSDATGMSVLLSYHQTFINAVRATGGNNASRTLVIQGPAADIDKTNSLMNTLPTDPISGRMMVEIHYYTPYQFCLMSQDASWGNMFYYWGKGYHSATDVSRNSTWGEESYVDSALALMQTKFVSRGIPVIMGEYAAMKRSLPAPSDEALHLASRLHFYRYVVSSARSKGIIPYCWDINMGIFNRGAATVLDPDVINAMMQGAGNAYVTFSNVASGLLIDGMYRNSNGSSAGQWSSSGSDAQQWQMIPVGTYVELKNKATGLYLDGMYNYSNGSAAGQWAYSGSDAQQWLIVPAEGNIELQNKATGLYLDGMYQYSNGSNLGQWSASGSTAQQWSLNTTSQVQTTGGLAQNTIGNSQRSAFTDSSSAGNMDGGVRLYPNPFHSTFTIAVDDPAKVDRIIITDLAGDRVEVLEHPALADPISIGASLKPGIYLVQVSTTSGTKTFKVVKLN
jgi:endoglucanase